MKLIGMLDSPYVRRAAISLLRLGVPFEHQSLSVFRTFGEFRAINPVVKAPTLVCDDGTVLMDSTLIIDYAETLAGRSLMPADPATRARYLRIIGLALAACEKSVQIVYENGLRPPEKAHAPWLERVTGQLQAACADLEQAFAARPRPAVAGELDQASITTAVAWHFVQKVTPEVVESGRHPALAAWSSRAESLGPFRAAPHGDGTVAGR